MNAWFWALLCETSWLATIYGKRFFDWWDRLQARADALLDDDLYRHDSEDLIAIG